MLGSNGALRCPGFLEASKHERGSGVRQRSCLLAQTLEEMRWWLFIQEGHYRFAMSAGKLPEHVMRLCRAHDARSIP